MPEVLSRASMLLTMDSRPPTKNFEGKLRGNDDQECTDYYETLIMGREA